MSSAVPVTALAAAIALTAHPADARAGVLSKVVSGMKKKAGQDDDDAHHAASADDDDGDADYDSPSGPADGPGWIHPDDEPGVPLVIWTGPYPTASRGTDVSMYAALQAVRDSDGSATVSLQSSYGALGVAVANTRYFERRREADGLLTLDMWSIAGAYRLAFGDRERTAMWIRAGIAGAATDGLSAVGLAVGAHAAHNFTSSLGLDTEARAVVLQHGIRGLEVRGGVAASFLRLSYRVLKLDDSPALRGPEVGVAFTF